MRKKKFASINDFKKDIIRIQHLIKSIHFRIDFFERAPSSEQFKHVNWKVASEKYDFLAELGEERIDNFYELGFIRLFASFESFMYEFMKELYLKYPNALPSDRKVNISDVLEWKTEKSIREYILDHIAIENSYDLITWEKTLKNSFGIDVFKDVSLKKGFEMLNICRNMTMHAGGKFNSKIERDARKFLNTYEREKQDGKKSLFTVSKMDLSYEQLYHLLGKILNELIEELNKDAA